MKNAEPRSTLFFQWRIDGRFHGYSGINQKLIDGQEGNTVPAKVVNIFWTILCHYEHGEKVDFLLSSLAEQVAYQSAIDQTSKRVVNP